MMNILIVLETKILIYNYNEAEIDEFEGNKKKKLTMKEDERM